MPELKSTAPHPSGKIYEERVVGVLKKQSYLIIRQNLKTPYAEVDLLVSNRRGEWAMVEVKSMNHWEFLNHRLSFKQRRRLLRARLFLEAKLDRPVAVLIAYVDKSKIHWLLIDP